MDFFNDYDDGLQEVLMRSPRRYNIANKDTEPIKADVMSESEIHDEEKDGQYLGAQIIVENESFMSANEYDNELESEEQKDNSDFITAENRTERRPSHENINLITFDFIDEIASEKQTPLAQYRGSFAN